MHNNSQSRKWLLTINNPQDCGLNHDTIIEILMRFSVEYFCLADEVGQKGTPHTHIFLQLRSATRFSTVKNRFPTAHIDRPNGSAVQNRDYIMKCGKWSDSDKAETSVAGSFYEYGTIPPEKSEKNPQMFQLIEDVREGKTTVEIVDNAPNMAFRIKDIDALRQAILSERYAAENRNIEVCYVYGATGTGKTRGIYQKHNGRDICRITNFRVGRGITFDAYSGQDVLVFEEFNSQIPIEEMLNYLDIYPLMLPARYSDKVACYTKVYITSNTSLYKQYTDAQYNRPETWRAFLRRISTVIEYHADGSITESINHKNGGKNYVQN